MFKLNDLRKESQLAFIKRF